MSVGGLPGPWNAPIGAPSRKGRAPTGRRVEAVGQVVIGDHEVMHLGPEDSPPTSYRPRHRDHHQAKEASSSAAMSARSALTNSRALWWWACAGRSGAASLSYPIRRATPADQASLSASRPPNPTSAVRTTGSRLGRCPRTSSCLAVRAPRAPRPGCGESGRKGHVGGGYGIHLGDAGHDPSRSVPRTGALGLPVHPSLTTRCGVGLASRRLVRRRVLPVTGRLGRPAHRQPGLTFANP